MIKNNKAVGLLENYINANEMTPQSKLPPERQLCEILGISRGEVRKALNFLEAEGRIWRHIGRGTFIGKRPLARLSEISDLSAQTNPAEVMQARLLIEPGISEIAAIHASNDDIDRMRFCSRKKDASTDWHTYERWDSSFHQSIAEATHNTLLLTLFNALNTVREATELGRLRKALITDERRQRSSQQHTAIIDAIVARDKNRASAAMRDHLMSVQKVLLGSDYLSDDGLSIDKFDQAL